MGLMDILLPLLLLGGAYYLMQTGQLDKILTGAGLPAPPPPFGSGAKPEKPLQLPTPQQIIPTPATAPPPSSGGGGGGGTAGSTATGKTIYQAIGNIMTAGTGVTVRGGGTSFRDNIGYPCNKCAREATWIFKPGTGGDWSPKLGSHGDEGGKETLIELGNISINGTGGDWRCEGPHMTYNDVAGGSGGAPKIGGLPRVGIKAVTWPLGGNRIHHELWWDQTGSGNNWKKFAEFNGAATGCNAITCPVPGSKCQDTMRLDNPSGHQFIARSMVEIRPGAGGGGGGGGTTTAPTTTPVGGGDTVVKKVAAVIMAPATLQRFSNDDASLASRLWSSIAQPGLPGQRFIKKSIVTVTGKVVGKVPHYNTDGDLVFGLMPDPQYKNLLTAASAKHTISGGGLWCEAVCQKPNTSIEPVHLGDCSRGGPFPTFPMPKLGERWSVTGLYVIDVREGGHSEIHPITRMSKL